jgi:hypothetical protein
VTGLFPRRPHIRATAMRYLRRLGRALAQRGVGVDGFANVDGVGAHLKAVWSRLRRGHWQWRDLMPSRGTSPF